MPAAALLAAAAILAACAPSPAPGRSTGTTMPTPTVAGTLPPSTTTVPAFSGFLVQSVSFVTDDDGFALGLVSCPPRACLAMRHTTDGGRTWVPLAPPPATPSALDEGAPPEVHFADALDGWVLGRRLWATHDGGVSWHAVAVGGTVLALASGAGEAYALVEPCPGVPCAAQGHLYRSPARQDRWSAVASVSADFPAEPASSTLVVEGTAVDVIASRPAPHLWTSEDGEGFVTRPVPCTPPAPAGSGQGATAPGALAASDPDDMVLVCLGGVAAGSQVKQAWISHDGARSFTPLPAPPLAGDGASPAMPAPGAVFLASWSAASFLYRDVPAGAPWARTVTFDDGGLGIGDLGFVDLRHGFFVHAPAFAVVPILGSLPKEGSPGVLYATDDGGTTWHPVPVG